MIEFKQFIADQGFKPPEYPLPVGKYFRFGEKYKYWGFLFDDCLGGVVGCWSTGERYVWQSRQSKRTPYERFQFSQHLKEVKAIEEAKRNEEYEKAALIAQEQFDKAKPADPNHPYLVTKKVGVHGIKQKKDVLLIPVYSVMGDLQSVQKIDGEGNKRFMGGCKVAGGCHMIGVIKPDKPIVICEGYATGASLLEGGYPFVIIAFNAGNLIHVAKDLREQLPDQEIIIAGDADPVGKANAYEAALAVGGKAIIPDFGDNENPDLTDFNDLAQLEKNEI